MDIPTSAIVFVPSIDFFQNICRSCNSQKARSSEKANAKLEKDELDSEKGKSRNFVLALKSPQFF